MCQKAFLRESWSWSSSFSFPRTQLFPTPFPSKGGFKVQWFFRTPPPAASDPVGVWNGWGYGIAFLRRLKTTSASTERQKRSQNLAPVLVILSGNSLVFSRKMITSTGFYRCCAAGASVVKNQSPISSGAEFSHFGGWNLVEIALLWNFRDFLGNFGF